MRSASLPLGKEVVYKGFLVPALFVAGAILWLMLSSVRIELPAKPASGSLAAVLNVGILVFREGLECILVLAALTAGMTGPRRSQRRPIFLGAALGFLATLITWHIAVQVIGDLSEDVPALDVQAATGLLAVIVLLTVMNWFFHRIYWTGWISLHSKKKRGLVESSVAEPADGRQLLLGFTFLGFSSFYREGFEVVLFLQSYRLRLGNGPVLEGALLGMGLTATVAVLTFVVHRHLPYRKMLILTGVLLGMVLLVMVGEQVQEMQLAGWLPTTTVPWLTYVLPDWAGVWFSLFPNLESLLAQAFAAAAVIGSYAVARRGLTPRFRIAEANQRET